MLGDMEYTHTNVISMDAYKAARPARQASSVVERWPHAARPMPSRRSVEHRQLMLAFLERSEVSESSPATTADRRTGNASL